MRRRLTRRALAAAILLMLAATGIAVASGASSTVNRTIADRDGDNRLEPAPGDDYLRRDELGTRTAVRPGLPLLTFGQFTDTHLVDEESPARVEFTDRLHGPFTSAYRPQEGLGLQVSDAMVREMANAVSPVTSERIEAVMTTGDNTDNTQCNETRWMIDIHDGAANGDPDSRSCLTDGLRPTSRQVDPNSGVEGSCGTVPDGSLYDGVRGDREYYEPDASDGEDGPGYSPREEQNLAEAQRSSTVRDFPGLFERMNEPFLPTGFKDLPWYGIFGNHDGLVQGNQNRNAALDALATGCVKVTGLRSGDLAAVAQDPRRLLPAVSAAIAAGLTRTVPQDPRRHLLLKREYMAQHFVTTGTPVGHGFTAENLASGQGNYAFSPKPGVRFVVLDSVSDAGGDGGNIDEAQFAWIRGELEVAEAARQLTLVFAHHTLETMNQAASPFPPGDNPPPPYGPVHLGEVSPQQPCSAELRGAEQTLKCLFLNHPTVIGYVTGHEHQNRIRAIPRSGVDGDEASGRTAGGFWQVTTASHIDWPQQSRLLDVVDNQDGSLSLWGTILDHDAPPNPGSAAGASQKQLASISRELSYNDPDARNGEDGRPDARGGEGDRNVELVVRDPR